MRRIGREHGVHKQPVAARRRDAPCGGMGAGDQAQVFKVRHHVADGGRRQFQPRGLRERTGTHGLAVRDVAVDQGLEQQLGTIVEHGVTF